MGYRELYQESNEQAAERFELVMERIAQIAEQTDVPEVYDDYFKKTAAFLLQLKEIVTEKENASTETKTMEALEQENKALYEDLFAITDCMRNFLKITMKHLMEIRHMQSKNSGRNTVRSFPSYTPSAESTSEMHIVQRK